MSVVAVTLMRNGDGLTTVRRFAIEAWLWPRMLLGRGSLEPLARTESSVRPG